MKKYPTWLFLAALWLATLVAAHFWGVFRGYQRESLIASDFNLIEHESIYHDIEKGQSDSAKKTLLMLIANDSFNLESIHRDSFHDFLSDYSVSQARNDQSGELNEAHKLLGKEK